MFFVVNHVARRARDFGPQTIDRWCITLHAPNTRDKILCYMAHGPSGVHDLRSRAAAVKDVTILAGTRLIVLSRVAGVYARGKLYDTEARECACVVG